MPREIQYGLLIRSSHDNHTPLSILRHRNIWLGGMILHDDAAGLAQPAGGVVQG